MKPFTAKFTKEKETKNTVRYQEDSEDGQPPRIGTLYVQKWVVGDATKLVVSVQSPEE